MIGVIVCRFNSSTKDPQKLPTHLKSLLHFCNEQSLHHIATCSAMAYTLGLGWRGWTGAAGPDVAGQTDLAGQGLGAGSSNSLDCEWKQM